MKKKFVSASLALALSALALSACASNEKDDADEAKENANSSTATITGTFGGAGSSAQEAAQASWISHMQKQNPDLTINYSPVGSGAGRTQFIEGSVSYAGSDSYLSNDELQKSFARCTPGSKAIDLPVYISPIALVYNIEGVDKLRLDAPTVAKIFRGTITRWNDTAIKALNPEAKLPDMPITAVHRSDDSGTTKNFTDYLHANAPQVWTEKPADTFPSTVTGGEGAQGTSGVISAVMNGKGTIGYADGSRAKKLSIAQLKVGNAYVALSSKAAAKVVDASPMVEGREKNDLAINIDRTTTEAGAYPLVMASYLIACDKYAQSKDAEFVKAYAKHVTSKEGQDAAAKSAGSSPISEKLRQRINSSINGIK